MGKGKGLSHFALLLYFVRKQLYNFTIFASKYISIALHGKEMKVSSSF